MYLVAYNIKEVRGTCLQSQATLGYQCQATLGGGDRVDRAPADPPGSRSSRHLHKRRIRSRGQYQYILGESRVVLLRRGISQQYSGQGKRQLDIVGIPIRVGDGYLLESPSAEGVGRAMAMLAMTVTMVRAVSFILGDGIGAVGGLIELLKRGRISGLSLGVGNDLESRAGFRTRSIPWVGFQVFFIVFSVPSLRSFLRALFRIA